MTNEVEDVEEGEISDTTSVEEITEEDFKQQQQDVVKGNDNKPKEDSKSKEDSTTRVWDVNDLYSKYPTISRGYASGMYNLAWAQAVQNKPLNDIFVMDIDSDANANDDSLNRLPSEFAKEDDVGVNGQVVIDLDKEDGELEEDEIDGDADPEGGYVFQSVLISEEKSVRKALEGFTIANVEEISSFPSAFQASKLFELHLYTMGNKLYATEMAKVLDPNGTLFNGRVISRGDDTDSVDGEEKAPENKDLEGVLGMESAVVIIDDSVRVWPHNKLNLIVVERYTYFPCSRRQFGLPGPSLLEIDHDERPEAGTLASSLRVIERIHQNFFASQSLEEVDVRNILASEQRKILAGCGIVFSRVFSVGEANPHLHPLF